MNAGRSSPASDDRRRGVDVTDSGPRGSECPETQPPTIVV